VWELVDSRLHIYTDSFISRFQPITSLFHIQQKIWIVGSRIGRFNIVGRFNKLASKFPFFSFSFPFWLLGHFFECVLFLNVSCSIYSTRSSAIYKLTLEICHCFVFLVTHFSFNSCGRYNLTIGPSRLLSRACGPIFKPVNISCSEYV